MEYNLFLKFPLSGVKDAALPGEDDSGLAELGESLHAPLAPGQEEAITAVGLALAGLEVGLTLIGVLEVIDTSADGDSV